MSARALVREFRGYSREEVVTKLDRYRGDADRLFEEVARWIARHKDLAETLCEMNTFAVDLAMTNEGTEKRKAAVAAIIERAVWIVKGGNGERPVPRTRMTVAELDEMLAARRAFERDIRIEGVAEQW